MIDTLLFLLLCTVIQCGILRVWLDSELFRPVQTVLMESRETPGVVGFISRLLTCWQCFGVWTGWFVVFVLTWFLDSSPIQAFNIPVIFCMGIGVGFLSDLVEAFVIGRMN